jgi:hypothetical protein
MANLRVLCCLPVLALVVACQASISGQGSALADGSAQANGSGAIPAGCPAPGTDPSAYSVDRGQTPKLGGNHVVHPLAAGTYRGDLKVGGNNVTVCGAGAGQTIVEGALELGGNHNQVRGLTVRKRSKVGGNRNSAEGTQFADGVDMGGNHTQ